MCMMFYGQDSFRPVRRKAWGKMFGLFIQSGRKKMGYSVEEAACLAVMEPSAWEAVEGGRVPETAAQLRLMAGVLQFSKEQLGAIVFLCQGAWER
jgi:transcriptional regulator with XRE-family HTH domain